ncbi:hypothetical protein [Aureimonas jatrophae]|uniref:Glycosyltransferase family 29 (Sialyltransferase) n=1 Tax=Aureimonas jatrophae TaxID=1166073 RepID=A0A1H0KW15_9HYPH|nr:hypothetical protein [Aureimonas jatrophae]MBB3948895.1 hypothetical protein [Aureimonas jatrophae]SDO59920.1 hypothetical protein SAMN05192530_108169 [Aureimonas jatrophae]
MFAEIDFPRRLNPPPAEVAIVGNAPGADDHAGAIDAADWVVRFNNAAGFGGPAGRRTTHLALVNRGGQMREWLEDRAFTQRPLLTGAGSFLLPFPPDAGRAHAASADGRDWTRPAMRTLRALGRPVRLLPHALHRQARHCLRAEHGAEEPNPSTGFLVAFHIHRQLRGTETRIRIYGFGFAGWPGHPWAAERDWFAAREREGSLRLVPING